MVSYKACVARSYFPEHLEVYWGKGTTVAELDQVITEDTELDNTENRLFEKVITAPEDGTYYIGFHATSNPASINIFIDSVSVSPGCDPASPAQVENLKVTPDQTGELKVTLDFNLPTKTYNGAELTAITRYEVLKGDAVLALQEGGLRPGDAVSVVDENAVKGVHCRLYGQLCQRRCKPSRKGSDGPVILVHFGFSFHESFVLALYALCASLEPGTGNG